MNNHSTMDEPNSGNAMATFSLVAVIVVVGLIALFVWQPWNLTTDSQSTITITQPGKTGATNDGSGTSTQRNAPASTSATSGKSL